jgi:hypothetical protein
VSARHCYAWLFTGEICPSGTPGGKALFLTWRLHARLSDTHALARLEIAAIVRDALAYGEKQLLHYDLLAWVIMSNHIHVLLMPLGRHDDEG